MAAGKKESFELVALVGQHLLAMGFIVVKRTRSSPTERSWYLRLPPYPWRIRLSDHRQSRGSATRHRHFTVRNIVLKPLAEEDVYLFAVETAVRHVAMCRLKCRFPDRNIKPKRSPTPDPKRPPSEA